LLEHRVRHAVSIDDDVLGRTAGLLAELFDSAYEGVEQVHGLFLAEHLKTRRNAPSGLVEIRVAHYSDHRTRTFIGREIPKENRACGTSCRVLLV
ncbi:hypothetical protein PMAYCL1PPCAC_31452, partial [Pristionchus mayeri]